MALFKLLFSILLLGLVYSAPVDVPTEKTTDGVQESAITISDVEKGAKSPTKTVDLTSGPVLTSFSTEQSDLSVEKSEGDSAPTDVVREDTTSWSPSDAILLDRNSDPIPDLEVISQTPDDEKEQQKERDNIPEESDPEVDPSASDTSQVEDEIRPTFDEKPEISQGFPVADSNPSQLEEANTPLEVAEPPQEPYDDRPLDLTPDSLNEEATNDEVNNPQTPVDAESDNQEETIQFVPEDTGSEITPENVQNEPTEIKNEPQNTEQINNDDIPLGSDPSQVEDERPSEIAQPENVEAFEPYGAPDESIVDTKLLTPDQSDGSEEQEDNSPSPSLSITVEEMVGDPVELPMREEPEPPAILVREDLAPPMLPVIHVEQQGPQYDTEEVAPFSDDSTKGETPEEEVSNSDNQEMLNFDNRPEQSGPMNIL